LNKNFLFAGSAVGAQPAAPGPIRKCRPLMPVVMLYLWRHRAQSTMIWSFVFWRKQKIIPFCKNFRQI